MVTPGDSWPDWKILGGLRALLTREPRPKSPSEVFAAMAAEVPAFAGMTHAALGAGGLDLRRGDAAAGTPAAPAERSV